MSRFRVNSLSFSIVCLRSYLPVLVSLMCCMVIVNGTSGQKFSIVSATGRVSVLYDVNGPSLDSVVANLFAQDVERLTGYKPQVFTNPSQIIGSAVVIGTISSRWVRQVLGDTSRLVAALKGKWECYAYQVIPNAFGNSGDALVVAGSDVRGTAYGLLSLSEKIGVSPWYWWADVPVKKQTELAINQPLFISKSPSVKFRGIFLNDEDWGLQPWAAETFEREKHNIGPRTYEKIFELLLRLKGNLIWPAMHEGTEPFFHDPNNVKMAEAYHIIVGTSHAEPMLRNNVGEWDKTMRGAFNYITNRNSVLKYWDERVLQSKNVDAMYTLGMRGVHDSKMEGIKDLKEAVPYLENIFNEQRAMLSKHLTRPANEIPQVFTAYKEVLEIYDNGLNVPDDVTLVWPDDNYGYIHRLNTAEESKRTGGSGVYYHASYWGRPHDYLWLDTTHPALMREEFMKAYHNFSRKIWVLNVGDLKSIEYAMNLFLDMAYDSESFSDSKNVEQHLHNWSKEIFGEEYAGEITDIRLRYYDLAYARKPEFMGWSQTEPTTKVKHTAFNHFDFGDEAQERINRYQNIQSRVEKLRTTFSGKLNDAFYELIYYPVVSASLMNKKFIYRDKAYFYAKQNRIGAHEYVARSQSAYDSIVAATNCYNISVAGGKWQSVMSMRPRDLPVFQPPVLPSIKVQNGNGWEVLPEGYDTADFKNDDVRKMPSFTTGLDESYFLDIYLSDSIDLRWTAKPSTSWIELSADNGILSSGEGRTSARIWVKINSKRLPKKKIVQATIAFAANGLKKSIRIQCIRPDANDFKDYKGYVEKNGVVSIYAANSNAVTNTRNSSWQILDHLGHAGAVIESTVKSYVNVDSASIRTNNARLSYTFYSLSESDAKLSVYTVPTHPLNKSFSMRYAVSVDSSALTIVDFKTFGRSEEWKQNVLQNQAMREINLGPLKPGIHSLTIYAIDPGVMVDRMTIRFGNAPSSYGATGETWKSN
jgi:hypothetical protein